MQTVPALAKETSHRSWAMLGLILLVQIVSPTGYYGLSALAPFILDDWSINRQQFGMLLSAFSTGTFLLAFPAGIFTDRIGVISILLGGQAVIGVFVGISPWLPSYLLVLVAMFVAGAGYGLVNPAGSKAIYSWFPQNRRAMALSIKQSSLPLCGVLSGLLLPPLSLGIGWRRGWMAAGLATLTTAVLTKIYYKDPPANNLHSSTDTTQWASAITLLRHGAILRLGLSSFFLTGIQICWHGYITVYMKDHLGMTAVTAGAYLALMQACAIFGRPAQGAISDMVFKGSRRNVLVMIGIVSLILGVWIALLPPKTPMGQVALILSLFGLTGLSWHGVHLTWMTEIAGSEAAGAASGLWIGSCHLAIIFIGPIFGAIVDHTGVYIYGWLFTCLLAGFATILLLCVRHKKCEAV